MRGGARPGAGRPKGVPGKKIRAEIRGADGAMPKDVMLAVMRQHYKDMEYDKAAEVAAKVAPYLHPRLAASTVTARER
jgi:hypothetical protein